MSSVVGGFAVEKTIFSIDQILSKISQCVKKCGDTKLFPEDLCVVFGNPEETDTFYWFNLCGNATSPMLSGIDRLKVEALFAKHLKNFIYIVWDDRVGVTMFRQFQKGKLNLCLIETGGKVGIGTGEITVDYAQKGMTPEEYEDHVEQLRKTLPKKQRDSIPDPEDAITIGFRQTHPGYQDNQDYFLFDPVAWKITQNGKPISPERIDDENTIWQFKTWIQGIIYDAEVFGAGFTFDDF